MEKYPETPVEVLLTSLMDYKNVITDTAKKYPEDKDVQEMVKQYDSSFVEFQKLVENKKWKPVNDEVQNIISIFTCLSSDSRACLLSGLGSYIDIVSQTISSNEKADDSVLNFYESLVNLFNDVAAIFSELDPTYTYSDFICDIISDGIARFPEHKVFFDSIQEQKDKINSSAASLDYIKKLYESFNLVEKKYFTENLLPSYILNTETALEKLEQSGKSLENMKRMMNSVIAAKKVTRELLFLQ